ncbi:helix-turn-helix domain-containing protein [Kitasatospora sp. NPDC001683]
MDHQLQEFADWLREQAAAAGYDPATRGGISELARAAGTDRGQTGRAFRGEVRPSIDSQRAWARVLDVPLHEMLVRSGTLQADDIPTDVTPPKAADLDLYEAARRYGIPEERRHLFVASVEAVAKSFAEEPKGGTIIQSQTGGLSAKR